MILTDGLTPVALPDDLEWPDEYAWSPVEQSAEYSLTGALVVDQGTRETGRPITLQSGADFAMVAPETVAALYAWAAEPGLELTLTIRSQARTVIFRHHDAPACEATPYLPSPEARISPLWKLTLKFMEV